MPIDTDQFGTFSGEAERTGSIVETIRKKVEGVASFLPAELPIRADFVTHADPSECDLCNP